MRFRNLLSALARWRRLSRPSGAIRAQEATSVSPAGSRFLRPEDLRRFHNFHFAARIVVEGFYAGRHHSPYHDTSAEFVDHRPYVPGDAIRWLDWRAYARTDRDYVRRFRKETDMPCHILLDASASMAFGSDPSAGETVWTKFEYACYLTAALCYLIVQQGDQAGLIISTAGTPLYVPCGRAIPHLRRLLVTLERVQPAGDTHVAFTLRQLFAMVRRRGLLVVISDLIEETDALFEALAMYGHRGWQILIFHVLTEEELLLPGTGPTRYLDPEGPDYLDVEPEVFRDTYRAGVRQWLRALEDQCKARRIHYARTTTATPYDHALERFLTCRTR